MRKLFGDYSGFIRGFGYYSEIIQRLIGDSENIWIVLGDWLLLDNLEIMRSFFGEYAEIIRDYSEIKERLGEYYEIIRRLFVEY